MFIKSLKIKNFRCFGSLDISFDGPATLIQGSNGAGKTSLLEALHYICYMRSFRTHTPRDLIAFGKDTFFVKVLFNAGDENGEHTLEHELQVGFSKGKKSVKLNKKALHSFKELIDHYRVLTVTEDDLEIIKGGPDVRRAFLDNAIFLIDPSFIAVTKEFKKVLENRNVLLQSERVDQSSYLLWTEQLWQKSKDIQKKREKMTKDLAKRVNEILQKHFEGEKLQVELEYKPKNVDLKADYDSFLKAKITKIQRQEMRFGRSLFGAHLDDLIITFCSKKSKFYASRGQQKLIVLLLKASQLSFLTQNRGLGAFLLDDFMTDFDHDRAQKLTNFLFSLQTQLIFTSPSRVGFFEDMLTRSGTRKILLTP